jgi:hypothetical protein
MIDGRNGSLMALGWQLIRWNNKIMEMYVCVRMHTKLSVIIKDFFILHQV